MVCHMSSDSQHVWVIARRAPEGGGAALSVQRDRSSVFWGQFPGRPQTQQVTLTGCLTARPHLWVGGKPVCH